MTDVRYAVDAGKQFMGQRQVDVVGAARERAAESIADSIGVAQRDPLCIEAEIQLVGVGLGISAREAARISVVQEAYVARQRVIELILEAAVDVGFQARRSAWRRITDPADVGGPDAGIQTALVRQIEAAL